ncbi:hypothetical protein Tco_1125150 [Tanacetum coccineum]|uniref:Uncharacterized protein n=1 Tax=Tanacetum coccineum TaxID=301880 RepID=A0ABQ5J9X2_9ASTR
MALGWKALDDGDDVIGKLSLDSRYICVEALDDGDDVIGKLSLDSRCMKHLANVWELRFGLRLVLDYLAKEVYRVLEVVFWVKKGFSAHVSGGSGSVGPIRLSRVWIRRIEGLGWIRHIHFHEYVVSIFMDTAYPCIDDHPALSEHVHPESAAKIQDNVINEPISEPLAGITTRSKIRNSKAASTHECLYVNFLSEMEPKKLIEALEKEG